MLFLNKLLPLFVLPLGWVFALLLYAILCKKRWPAFAALAVLFLCSTQFTGYALFRSLESQYKPIALDDVGDADAIVVLGGYLGASAASGYLHNVSEAGERLEAGVVLWHRQRSAWLVLSGAHIPWAERTETEGQQAKTIALGRGVKGEQILVTRAVSNTADEALAVAELMREHGWKRIVLITSAWHMPRAARLFREAGISFRPFPVDYQLHPDLPLTAIDFIPRARGLWFTESALREMYGIAFYALLG